MSEIVICGGSGLVGTKLAAKLERIGRSYSMVGRSAERLRAEFPSAIRCMSWAEFADGPHKGLRAVVNLAGASVMERRWTPEYKKTMTDSRLRSTSACAEVCSKNPEVRLLSASSVHAYGIYQADHEAFTEDDRKRRSGSCYLQELIDEWEAATKPATEAGCSVTQLRIGVVLAPEGGALKSMLLPFKLLLGGRQGSGKQIMPWISLDDLVSAIHFLLDRPELSGPVNLVAPNPCSNADFARALGRALGRPTILPAPSFAVKALMGQGGYELILSGQRVLPKRLIDAGFSFRDREISECLQRLLSAPETA